MSGTILILFLLCPQLAYFVEHMSIFLQWKNELNHTAELPQIQNTLNTLAQSLNEQGATLDPRVFN